ncbi:hypothetical protein MKW92_043018 [Papaver armeniacum]|nr:hypothetical protein MKW92_043018 [Papaver armeniacum]
MRNSLSPETKKPDEHSEVLQLSESSSSWKMDSSSGDSTPVEASAKEICNYSRLKQHLGGNVSPCVEVPEDIKVLHNPKKKNKVRQTQRCIGRFFIENGIDFSSANSSTFKNMIHALVGSGSTVFKVPSRDDLKGWILEEELKATQEHVRKVVCSWGSTGCSILLDGWTSETTGSHILEVGDVSDSIGDVDAMISLVSGVIDEVGVENVVQIVTYTTAGSMDAVGMLGTERVLSNAKAITKFIYSHETVLNLMRKYTGGVDLVSSSRIRSLMPFLILETIKSQKKNLRKMFASPDWKDSTLASTADGRMVSGLVTREPSFWTGVEMLLKVKEQIKKNHQGRKTKYQPLWTVIDGIWDDQLHSPIHAAGYYLNPGLFYFEDFCADSEVKTGFLCCIVTILEDKREQDLIARQFKEYKTLGGTFGCGGCYRSKTKWWSLYGVDCPELQRFAIRILSQTCTGALRYGLKRKQKRLTELTFVHHNLRLQNLPASNSGNTDIFLEPIDPMDEWISVRKRKQLNKLVMFKIAESSVDNYWGDASTQLICRKVGNLKF